MGLSLFSDCKNITHNINEVYSNHVLPVQLPNPDPKNFKIEKVLYPAGPHGPVVVKIIYPDCTNYEGRKILLLPHISLNDLNKLTNLDPHFCDSPKHISPIARFEPTTQGWNLACNAAKMLNDISPLKIQPMNWKKLRKSMQPTNRLKTLSIALDISNSVSTDIYEQVEPEIKQFGATIIDLRLFSHEIRRAYYGPVSLMPKWSTLMSLTPEGGTDMQLVFNETLTEISKPDKLIVISDMLSVIPTQNPGIPVTWILIPNRDIIATELPSFGEIRKI